MSHTTSQLIELLGDEAEYYLGHQSQTIPQSQLHLPGGDIIDRVWRDSDRPVTVLRNLQSLLNHGRLAGTGYTSIFPVDQGIEHAAGASFAKNTGARIRQQLVAVLHIHAIFTVVAIGAMQPVSEGLV